MASTHRSSLNLLLVLLIEPTQPSHISDPQSLHGPLPSSCEDDTSFTVNLEGQGPSPFSIGSSSDAHETGSLRSGGPSSGHHSGDGPLVTFRFEHWEDGDGHHVVIGREGKLSRCEDEVRTTTLYKPRFFSHTGLLVYQPISTPSAVRSFGLLIVVQEDLDGDSSANWCTIPAKARSQRSVSHPTR